MPYVLGIDQGTTQTTAVAVDEAGRAVASHSVEVPVRFPRSGWVEQDPWTILNTVIEAARPLLDTYPIEAIGFDNQGETFLRSMSRNEQCVWMAGSVPWQRYNASIRIPSSDKILH